MAGVPEELPAPSGDDRKARGLQEKFTVQLIRAAVLVAVVLMSGLSVAEAQEIYVPNYDHQALSVFDGVTLAPVGLPIPILPAIGLDCPDGGNPQMPALTLNHGHAFVTIDYCDQVAVVDTASHSVVKYIKGLPGSGETRIFLRPAGDRMYVTTCDFPTVTVLDVATRKMIGVIELPDGGSGPMVFSLNGSLGYAGNSYPGPLGVAGCGSPNGIYRLNLATNTVAGFIETSRSVVGLARSPNGGVALATGEDRILVVNLSTGTESAVMCGVAECEYGFTAGVAFNGDGSRAYVIDAATNELVTIDTTDLLDAQELSRVPIAGIEGAWRLRVSGNRAAVILASDPSEVVLFDISTDPPVQLPGSAFPASGFELDMWGVGAPTSADQCKNDEWKRFGVFKNQGDCVSFVASKGKNQPARQP